MLANINEAIPRYVSKVERGTAIIFAGKNQVGKVPKEYNEKGKVAIWAAIEITIGVKTNLAKFFGNVSNLSNKGRALKIPQTAANESWKPISKMELGFTSIKKKAALERILNGETFLFRKSATERSVNMQTARFTEGDKPVIAAYIQRIKMIKSISSRFLCRNLKYLNIQTHN